MTDERDGCEEGNGSLAAHGLLAKLSWALRSEGGDVRPHNEDHYLVVRSERALETLLTNLPPGRVPSRFAEVGYGMVVADGMGGQAAGEVASRMAISTLANLVMSSPDWIMRTGLIMLRRPGSKSPQPVG